MAKTSGRTNNYAAAGSRPIAVTSSGKRLTKNQQELMINSAERLDSLQHREVVRQLQQAISRYEKVMGLRERSIKVADIGNDYGVTFISTDGSHGIFLNKAFFNQSKSQIESAYRKSQYDTGFKNITNRPIQHTITHELAHATWASSYSSPKHQAAGKEISTLYKQWRADNRKKGYGRYAKQNVDEFWAEVVTKGIHGNSDKYTKKAIQIAKKYKL